AAPHRDIAHRTPNRSRPHAEAQGSWWRPTFPLRPHGGVALPDRTVGRRRRGPARRNGAPTRPAQSGRSGPRSNYPLIFIISIILLSGSLMIKLPSPSRNGLSNRTPRDERWSAAPRMSDVIRSNEIDACSQYERWGEGPDAKGRSR